MSLPTSIFAKLSDAGSATAAIIGSGATCKAWPGKASEKAVMPYVVFNVVSSSDEGADHQESSDFDLVDIQFSIIAATYPAAWALRRAIRADLSDVTLAGGEKPVGFIERDGFSEGVDAHVLTLDVSFWHNPSAA
jgi:hypothetical protein